MFLMTPIGVGVCITLMRFAFSELKKHHEKVPIYSDAYYATPNYGMAPNITNKEVL